MARTKQTARPLSKSSSTKHNDKKNGKKNHSSNPSKKAKTSVKGGKIEKPQKPRAPHRFRPGTVALRGIRRYQGWGGDSKDATKLLIPRSVFRRLMREVASQYVSTGDVRIQEKASDALQQSCEEYVTKIFARTQDLSIHRGAKTISHDDLLYTIEEFLPFYQKKHSRYNMLFMEPRKKSSSDNKGKKKEKKVKEKKARKPKVKAAPSVVTTTTEGEGEVDEVDASTAASTAGDEESSFITTSTNDMTVEQATESV